MAKALLNIKLTPRVSALFAALLTVLVFMAISSQVKLCFYINDDVAMQSIMSGSFSGTSSAHAVFSNYLLCFLIVGLYSIIPNAPWWFFALEFFSILSLFFWCFVSIRITHKSLQQLEIHNWLLPVMVAGVSGCCFFLFPIARPSFTFTAAALAAGGVFCFAHCLSIREANLRERIAIAVASVVLVFFSYLFRAQVGLIGLALFVLLAVYRGIPIFVRAKKDKLKDAFNKDLGILVIPVVSAAVMIFFAWGSQMVAYSGPEWVEFKANNAARSRYMDYSHDSYTQNPELYKSVGWDEPLSQLVASCFFMDERVNQAAFKTLVSESVVSSSKDTLTAFVGNQDEFKSHTPICFTFVIIALSGVVFLFGKRRIDEVVLCILAVSFLVACTLFLGYKGRLIMRAVYSAALPVASLVWFVCLSVTLSQCASIKNETSRWTKTVIAVLSIIYFVLCIMAMSAYPPLGLIRSYWLLMLVPAIVLFAVLSIKSPRAGCYVCILLLVISLIPTALAVTHDVRADNDARYSANNNAEKCIEYFSNNKEYVFVRGIDAVGSTDPYYSNSSNTIGWGGWTYYLPGMKSKLESIGYPEGFSGINLLDEQVLFVAASNEQVDLVKEYLNTQVEGTVQSNVLDVIGDGRIIVKFTLKG